jgi:branched-chain amino acid transport system ATP-binding protein
MHSLNFMIEEGSVNALIGPNGAGKTSTLMSIAGHVQVQEGKVLYEGNELNSVQVNERVRMGIALVPEGRRLFPDLTTEENLKIGGYHKPNRNYLKNRERVLDLFPRLSERLGQLAGSLSGGEQQMLAIGRALMAEPRLLLIDELSLGLMPKMIDQCYKVIRQLKKQGMTLLIVEQNTHKALEVSDRICILESGKSVWRGNSEDAKKDPNIFKAYMGMN